MPLIQDSDYQRPFYLINGHFETILPSIFRKIDDVTYERERLEIPDGDFLDLDWLSHGSHRLLVISHGLEGSSDRHYVKSMAKYFFLRGWDILAWNLRSCSGEMNRLLRLYHHGASDDLKEVVVHAMLKGYDQIALAGFSLGGSMTMKYLGEAPDKVPASVVGATVFSIPCNLPSSAQTMVKGENAFYRKRFLRKLKNKLKAKAQMHPGKIDLSGIDDIKDFDTFDTRFTAPIHGFKDATDFYCKVTCDQFLPGVKVPSLIVNAQNDPMLGEECYPYDLLKDHPNVWLETPKHGGHVGFSQKGWEYSWAEVRAYEFLEKVTHQG